jgi:hypothetical protein
MTSKRFCLSSCCSQYLSVSFTKYLPWRVRTVIGTAECCL